MTFISQISLSLWYVMIGARIQEGTDSLAGYADIFQRNVDASGVVSYSYAFLFALNYSHTY